MSNSEDVTRIERLVSVMSRTAKSRSSIYADISAGTFPAPIKIGARSVGWISAEVDSWIAQRAEQRTSRSRDVG